MKEQSSTFRPSPLPSPLSTGERGTVPARFLQVRFFITLTVLGIVARFALSAISLGSDDWYTWHVFGIEVAQQGLTKAYSMFMDDGTPGRQIMNHPPIPLLWSALVAGIAARWTWSTGYDGGLVFANIFRLPCIAADIGVMVLLYRIWSRRGADPRAGWMAAAAYAWNAVAIMIGAYHCNTDNIVAFLTLWSAYLLYASPDGRQQSRPFWGGLVLGAAINVKIVPVLLILPLASLLHDWRSFGRYIGGLAVAAIPFAIVIAITPRVFVANVLGYKSIPGPWGPLFILGSLQHIPLTSEFGKAALECFYNHGRYLVLAAVAALAVASWVFRRRGGRAWDALQLGALAWAIFLIIPPGFGFQYAVFVAPLMMAVDLRRGSLYGLFAGLFAATAYGKRWIAIPLESMYREGKAENPLPLPLMMVAWVVLIGFALVTLRRRATTRAGEDSNVKVAANTPFT